MLNPYLNLNQKIFDNPQLISTREGLSTALIELGKTNPNVVVLSADLKESTKCEEFSKNYPDRYFEVGVAEQNMAAIAAGLGVSGKIPLINSYAVFSPGKNLETIRTTIAYNNADVKVCGHHAGIITGEDGATHQATEDIAIMRSIPNFKVIVPCDAIEAKKAVLESINFKGPVYLRFSREKTPILTTNETQFDLNKIQLFWTSENPKVTIFATGHLLYYSLLAAKQLENDGIQTLIVNVTSIKPLDEDGILQTVKNTKKAITVEDHQMVGGLGSALSEIFARKFPIPVEFIGIKDKFTESGKALELLTKYELDEVAIKNAVKKILLRE